MKKVLLITIFLCCFMSIAEAQKTKEIVGLLQGEIQSLNRKVDSLERIIWASDSRLATLESRLDKITDKMYEQAKVIDSKIAELASKSNIVADKPFEFIENEQYYANRLKVKHGAYYGFIDRSDSLVIPCVYDDANSFFDGGFTLAKKNGKWGVIDSVGVAKQMFEYDTYTYYGSEREENVVRVRKNNKWGVVRLTDGKEVIPTIHEKIETGVWGWNKNYQYIVTQTDGKAGLIDISGKVILRPIYQHLGWDGYGSYYRAVQNRYNVSLDVEGQIIKK